MARTIKEQLIQPFEQDTGRYLPIKLFLCGSLDVTIRNRLLLLSLFSVLLSNRFLPIRVDSSSLGIYVVLVVIDLIGWMKLSKLLFTGVL